jgi:hypothetical protein
MGQISRMTTWASMQNFNTQSLNMEFDNVVNTWNNHDNGSVSWNYITIARNDIANSGRLTFWNSAKTSSFGMGYTYDVFYLDARGDAANAFRIFGDTKFYDNVYVGLNGPDTGVQGKLYFYGASLLTASIYNDKANVGRFALVPQGTTGGFPGIEMFTNNVGIMLGQAATGSYGGGQGVIFIADRATAPTANPSGGLILYSEGGLLKYRSSSGDIYNLT